MSILALSTQHALDTAGYAGIAGLLLISPPLPSEAVLPLIGYYASRHGLPFGLALVAAVCGALLNALIIYSLARWGGRELLLRRGRLLRLDEPRIARAEEWFRRFGDRIVLFGRMVSLARWLVGVPAGVARMNLTRYVLLTAAGATVWCAALIGAGSALGSDHSRAATVATIASLGLAVLAMTTALAVRRRRGRVPNPTAD